MNNTIKKIYAVVLTFSTLVYLGWRVIYTVPYDHGALSIVFAWILLVAEIFGAVELVCFFWFYLAKDKNIAPRSARAASQEPLPAVDVMVPTYGEPVPLLEKTLRACLAMRYAGQVCVWLLDDASRPEMKELADRLQVGYLFRHKHVNAKAGNLNSALGKTKAPLIAVFDADMAPRPEFLERTVPLMTKGVAYVQTPQSFRNRDLFQKAYGGAGIPNEQDFFYRSIEPARNAINAVVLAGSNMLLSREALEAVGGFVTETLTEDFATGIALQKKGYRGVAVTETLAEGETPESLGALIRQRVRWASGCIQSGRKERILFGRGLTLRQRMSYLMAVSYWYFPVKRLVYLLAPLLYSFFGVAVMRCDLRSAALFWLPMYLLTTFGIPLFSGQTRTVGWSMFYESCLTPFLLIPVIRESLGIRQREFKVTDKSGSRDWRWWMVIPHAFACLILAAAVVCSVRLSLEVQSFQYVMLVLWNVYHLYLAFAGVLFVLNCKKSKSESLKEELPHRLSGRELAALKLPRLLASLLK
ncbi:MAG: glycosyltransferase [Firmicutes bacterium]|nr:glycosyltransferase [Bacillota bacterium]